MPYPWCMAVWGLCPGGAVTSPPATPRVSTMRQGQGQGQSQGLGQLKRGDHRRWGEKQSRRGSGVNGGIFILLRLVPRERATSTNDLV